MEKEEQKLEEQEAEETNPLVRNSKKIPAESDWVLDNETEAINGDKNFEENLVFHHNASGIWKCRICPWTYGNGSVCVDRFQNHRGLLHNMTNIKTFNFVYEGLGVNHIVEGPALTTQDASSLDPVIQFNGASVITNQHKEAVKENGVSSSDVRHSDSSSQEDLVAKHVKQVSSLDPAVEFNGASIIRDQYEEGEETEANGINGTSHEPSKEIESAETEDDLEITELDVERVIRNQTTHDLHCPNCHSCITKKVILTKRKRRVRISDEEVKRPKTGTEATGTVSSEDQVHQEGEVGDQDAQTAPIDEDDRDRGATVFRCLSCFSIFIPTGDGIRLFRSYGGKCGKENARGGQAPDVKKSWFDMFNPNRQKTPVEEGSSSETNVQQVSSGILSSGPARESGRPLVLEDTAHEGRDLTLPGLDHLKLPLLVDSERSDDMLDADQQKASKPSREVQTSRDKDIVQLPQPSVSMAEDADGTLNISVSVPHDEQDVKATIVTTSVLDKPLRTGNTSEIGDAPAAQGEGNDTRITIDAHPPATVISPPTASQLGTQTSTADRKGRGAREEHKVEVIKSIIYGGLAETMTSLSVVSSAAGGGAATLNVLTLGAANLIGGLFIIAHNLWDLRCDRLEEQLSNQITEQADRYRQLLGQRQNFMLHAVVAIISYILFGLVPPVVYGFSFHESDDKQLKLLMVAVASLVCILVLTVGKAYVQRPPKPYLKTVTTFLILGISVSGMSYAAGRLVERLLEKLGLFTPSSAAPNFLVPEMRPVGSGWASD
ncbi:membrane protein of ER body-like protein isoform X1 [Salvia splendens]|uniref:membrane protein of ER body-like protein isoform X1 n=1 Tax=Salvia splendens TaxID=180675 RepID=UPI001C272838|nr:membrane protein of ER body-like protein isoform X1 [Salvia splendens]